VADLPYHPIDCGFHDELLALATLRRECEVVFLDEQGQESTRRSRIEDVYSRAGAEYLRLADGTTVRLDRLVRVDGRPLPPSTGP